MNQIPPIYRWRVYSSASKTKHFSWETSSALLRDHFLFFCGPTCAFLLRIYPFYFYLLPASNLQRSFRIWGVWDTKHFPHIVSSTMCLSRRCSRSWLANMPGSSALHPVGTHVVFERVSGHQQGIKDLFFDAELWNVCPTKSNAFTAINMINVVVPQPS